jgi:hypothetical protein
MNDSARVLSTVCNNRLLTRLIATMLLFCLGNWGCRERGSYPQVHHELRTLRDAVLIYQAEYGCYPIIDKRSSEQPSVDVIDVLSGDRHAATHLNIPSGKTFLSVPPDRRDRSGFRDPFGNPYHFAFDVEGNGICRVGTNSIRAAFVIWSDGPNRHNDFCAADDCWISDAKQ